MTDKELSPAEVRAALATLVAAEPDLPAGAGDIERRGRQRVARRTWAASAAAAVVVAAAGITAINLSGPSGPATPIAGPDVTASEPSIDTGLPTGFPVGSAVDAVGSALPPGAGLGELPMDIGWREGGLLDVPVVTAVGPATITVQVVDGVCGATAAPVDAVSGTDLEAIAAAVCAAWVETGSLPVIPAGPPGEEQPDLAAR
jgi:hypothetical protein